MLKKFWITCIGLFGMSLVANASFLSDSLPKPYIHNRSRAALFSGVIPGGGQIYNEFGYRKMSNKKHRAWWKVPLIYGGLGVCGYYFYDNNKWANLSRQEWLERDANDSLSYFDIRFNGLSKDQLINGDGNDFIGYDQFARRRDIFTFAFIGIWALNVVEAYVDAHFVSFDVSQDLSMRTYPTLLGGRNPGITLQFQFN